jgi:gliding motility-associated lipoprotein GldH
MSKFFEYFLYLSLVFIIACDKNTAFNSNQDFANAQWHIKDTAKFIIDISDPTPTYSLYYNVRNSRKYPYYNLFVTRYVYDATGKKTEEKLNELLLANETTGQNLGTGLGDIYDHKILVHKAYKFAKSGKYTFEIKQYMRQDPLPEILSFGIAIEKTKQ